MYPQSFDAALTTMTFDALVLGAVISAGRIKNTATVTVCCIEEAVAYCRSKKDIPRQILS
jgi:hypothetical protein